MSILNSTASVASERAVRDPQKVEDITDPNRPTRIKQVYKEFTDGDRMDAVDALGKVFPDKQANHRLVCEIFEVAFKAATMAINTVREQLPRTLVNPASLHTSQQPVIQEQNLKKEGKEPVEFCFKYSTIPDSETHHRDADIKNITDTISDYLKRTSSSVDITAMKQNVLSSLESRYPGTEKRSLLRKKLKLVPSFISECCKLAWQLVVQTPSMHIQYNEKKFDPVKHELPSTRKAPTSDRISHYVWPTLLNKLNGTVLCKGVVVIVDSEV
ncbi:Hypp2679 [Branchiostoma lanceolatum]|uniref:Mitochondria-eating protein n=1 Tax=Branchiostoma lanceolatum TaxID=7740 RepID=A0A8J9ZV48_BRALA|nr:Hypp2679 [Branchiostoma lanceolatum]